MEPMEPPLDPPLVMHVTHEVEGLYDKIITDHSTEKNISPVCCLSGTRGYALVALIQTATNS